MDGIQNHSRAHWNLRRSFHIARVPSTGSEMPATSARQTARTLEKSRLSPILSYTESDKPLLSATESLSLQAGSGKTFWKTIALVAAVALLVIGALSFAGIYQGAAISAVTIGSAVLLYWMLCSVCSLSQEQKMEERDSLADVFPDTPPAPHKKHILPDPPKHNNEL